jgi:FAD/FMN-containing dehydrogenase
MRPWARHGAPANFTSEESDDQLSRIYGPKLARLRQLKATYDPDNVFRLNQNISPGRTADQVPAASQRA